MMLPLILLFLPLLGALAVFLAGNKRAHRWAFSFSIIDLLVSVVVLRQYLVRGAEGLSVNQPWIPLPKVNFHLAVDGLSMLLIMLTNFLLPLIILSAFNRQIRNARSYFSLMLVMQFALLGVFMAMDGLLYYIFWELALIPIYFIALLWGGERRIPITLKFFIYTLAGSLLMLFGFIMLYWYNPNQSFDIRELYGNVISAKNQSWLFW